MGEFLGGVIATHMAAELSREKTPPAAMIFNSIFSSLTDVVAWQYPYFPFRFLLFGRYPSAKRIGDVTCPAVIIHGGKHNIVLIPLTRKLFAAAPETSAGGVEKQFVELPNGGHNEIPSGVLRSCLESVGFFLSNDSPRGCENIQRTWPLDDF